MVSNAWNITTTLPESEVEAIDDVAAELGISRSAVMRAAIRLTMRAHLYDLMDEIRKEQGR